MPYTWDTGRGITVHCLLIYQLTGDIHFIFIIFDFPGKMYCLELRIYPGLSFL